MHQQPWLMSCVTRWTQKGRDREAGWNTGAGSHGFFFFFFCSLSSLWDAQVQQPGNFSGLDIYQRGSPHIHFTPYGQYWKFCTDIASSFFFWNWCQVTEPKHSPHSASSTWKVFTANFLVWDSQSPLQRYNIELVMVNGAELQVCACARVSLHVCLPPIPHCWTSWKTRRSAQRHVLIWFIMIETLADSMYKKPAENLGVIFFPPPPSLSLSLSVILFLFRFN